MLDVGYIANGLILLLVLLMAEQASLINQLTPSQGRSNEISKTNESDNGNYLQSEMFALQSHANKNDQYNDQK